MTITVTNLSASEGAGTAPDLRRNPDYTSYPTDNWTPPTSGIIVAICDNAAGSTTNGPPTVTGNNLNWVLVHTYTFDNDERRISLYAAFASTAQNGETTFDFGSNSQTYFDASFFQIEGAYEGGTVDQVFTNFADGQSGSGMSITLVAGSSELDSGNRPLVGVVHQANETTTTTTDWTGLDNLYGPNTNRSLHTEYRSDQWDGTAQPSWSSSSVNAGFICEITSVSASQDYTTTISDDVGITDSMSPAVGYVKSLADSVGISDALSMAVGYAKTFTDTVGVTDAMSRVVTFVRTFADDVGITDALTKSKGMFLTIADSVGIIDIVSLESLVIHIGKIVLSGSRNFAKNLIGVKTGGPLSANTSYSENKDGGL